MAMVLPVPKTPQAEELLRETAQEWEQAAPTNDHMPQIPRDGNVTNYRRGPGDIPYPADEWMGIDLRDLPHEGIENGRGLFTEIPGPPPEGHGGYDIADADHITDRSTQHQALFWSDWAESTALQAGGRGSFTGEHVVIVRIPPGSVQGYMPSDPGMAQANNYRNLPPPWDGEIILGQGMGAATSQ